LDNNNYSSYALPLTGGTLSGTLSLNPNVPFHMGTSTAYWHSDARLDVDTYTPHNYRKTASGYSTYKENW
jgi:hypothetical protein